MGIHEVQLSHARPTECSLFPILISPETLARGDMLQLQDFQALAKRPERRQDCVGVHSQLRHFQLQREFPDGTLHPFQQSERKLSHGGEREVCDVPQCAEREGEARLDGEEGLGGREDDLCEVVCCAEDVHELRGGRVFDVYERGGARDPEGADVRDALGRGASEEVLAASVDLACLVG